MKTMNRISDTSSTSLSTIHFQHLLDEASEVYAVLSPDGRMVYLNRAGRRLLGAEVSTLAGTYFSAWIVSEEQATIGQILRHVSLVDRVSDCTLSLRRKNGVPLRLVWSFRYQPHDGWIYAK